MSSTPICGPGQRAAIGVKPVPPPSRLRAPSASLRSKEKGIDLHASALGEKSQGRRIPQTVPARFQLGALARWRRGVPRKRLIRLPPRRLPPPRRLARGVDPGASNPRNLSIEYATRQTGHADKASNRWLEPPTV